MDVCYMYVCPHIHEMYIIHMHTCSMQHAACRIYIIIMYDFIFKCTHVGWCERK